VHHIYCEAGKCQIDYIRSQIEIIATTQWPDFESRKSKY